MNDILAALGQSCRPLIICDIDEVVMEFLDPFQAYLASIEYRLHPDSFKLTGNIRRIADNVCATKEECAKFQEAFFAVQDQWQKPARNARIVLDGFKDDADIVFLTAMPPRHEIVRRALLDLHEFHFPMIATEDAKGPVAARLIGERGVPAVFIDDIHTNLHSVRTHAPGCLLINLMANDVFRALAPDPGERVVKARDWDHAGALIRAHFKAHA
ncbi:MAG: hypothetical protein JWM58_3358 [Rhizobium sp.]|nr:hypothetical protein [Rhizobium sp.]